MEFSYEFILEITESPRFNDLTDERVVIPRFFSFIIEWIENDKENRLSLLEDLMLNIDYDFGGFYFLVKKFASNQIVRESGCFSKNLLSILGNKMKNYEEELCNQHKLVSFNFGNDEDAKSIQIIDLIEETSNIHENIFPNISNFGFASCGSKIYFAGGKDEEGKKKGKGGERMCEDG